MRRGYTLVELLMAAAIGALLVGGLYVALSSGASAYRKSEAGDALEQDLRAAVRLVSRDVRATFVSPFFQSPTRTYLTTRFVGRHELSATGDADRLRLIVSGLPVAAGGAGRQEGYDLAEVEYRLDLDPSTPETGLVREISVPGRLVPPRVEEVAPLVTAVSFQYHDGKDWVASWGVDVATGEPLRELGKLPSGVKITVTCADPATGSTRTASTVVPVMVASFANLGT